MEVKLKEDPWKHGIVKNFFSQELFEQINSRSIEYLNSMDMLKYHPKFGSGHNMRFSGDRDELCLQIFEEVKEYYIQYYSKLDSGNEEFYSIEPSNLLIEYQYRPAKEDTIIEVEPNIHTDSPLKIMSFVIGLSESGSGTTLYNPDWTYHSITEYCPNNALMFVRNNTPGKETLHSILNTVDAIRRVLVVFVANPKHEKSKK
jgi:hypothetical protein